MVISFFSLLFIPAMNGMHERCEVFNGRGMPVEQREVMIQPHLEEVSLHLV